MAKGKKKKKFRILESVYVERKETASCLAGLLKGIRELGSRPLILQFSPPANSHCLHYQAIIQIKNGFPRGLLLPQEPSSLPPPHCLPSQQHSGIHKKNIKIKRGLRDLRRWMESGSYLGFSTIFLLQSLLNYTERKNRGQIDELPSEFTALKPRVHF